MIDSAKTDSTTQPVSSWPSENPPLSINNHSWIGTMGQTVLSSLLELYQIHKEKSERVSLLPDMMTMLESCVCQVSSSSSSSLSLSLSSSSLSLSSSSLSLSLSSSSSSLLLLSSSSSSSGY